MPNSGPIIYIEDDADDQFLVQKALGEINCTNEILSFDNGDDAYDYLEHTEMKPFLILCDLQIPGLNGFELKSKINQSDQLKKLSIPFIFLSGTITEPDVETAYSQLIQGFYRKESEFGKLKEQLKIIIDYWTHAIHPRTKL